MMVDADLARQQGSAADVRALVTGAAGFAGQWLCRGLLRSGWDVVGRAPE